MATMRRVRADLNTYGAGTSSFGHEKHSEEVIAQARKVLGQGGIIGYTFFHACDNNQVFRKDHRYDDFIRGITEEKVDVDRGWYLPKSDLLVVKVQGVNTREGVHFLALACPNDFSFHSILPIDKLIEESKKAETLLVPDQSYYKHGVMRSWLLDSEKERILAAVDGINTFKGTSVLPIFGPFANTRAESLYSRLSRKRTDIFPLVTSGAKHLEYISSSWMELFMPNNYSAYASDNNSLVGDLRTGLLLNAASHLAVRKRRLYLGAVRHAWEMFRLRHEHEAK